MIPLIILVLVGVAIAAKATLSSGTEVIEVIPTDTSSLSKATAPSGFNVEEWLRYDYWFQVYSKKYGCEWKWLKAFALNESQLGKNGLVARGAVSSDGLSYGLMQLTFPTAGDQAGRPVTKEELNDPETSIKWAAKFVANLSDYFDGDLDSVVQAYNEGAGNVNKGKTVPAYLARWKRNFDLVNKYS